MVEAVRRGQSQRDVARSFQVALSTLQWWLKRAEGQPLDQVEWTNRSSVPRRSANRIPPESEWAIVECRQRLASSSALGFSGAQAIQETLRAEGTLKGIPSVRTIGRVLKRQGALDGRRRWRRPAPPPGWYIPALSLRQAEVDTFDVIEGLVIEGRGEIEVLTGKALWGPTAVAWPMSGVTAHAVLEHVLPYWRRHGLPHFAQFDNDTRFQGGHNHPDVLGRVVRVCLSLGITPIFVPPREHGFQAVIEHFNGLWQAKVWQRFHHADLAMVQSRSEQFLAAYCRRLAQRTEHSPPRRPFPPDWSLNLQRRPCGQVIYLRRTDAQGHVALLGRTFLVDPTWPHRLLRCEVDLAHHQIRCYRLRRREPDQQPLVKLLDYVFPTKPFRE
jgi:transposase